jgi:formylglycine-generating enzyme required for sulfatase activity
MNCEVRGGSYADGTWDLRASIRFRFVPGIRLRDVGFRIVVSKKRSRQ